MLSGERQRAAWCVGELVEMSGSSINGDDQPESLLTDRNSESVTD
jgi:hypothetical protein